MAEKEKNKKEYASEKRQEEINSSKSKVEEKCECESEDVYTCEQPKDNYLEMAQRIQAEFDNYRKRSVDLTKIAKQEGIIDAILKFLPALDSFNKAKTMIKDKAVLEGIEIIENNIKNSLKELEVEEIKAKGQQFDPNYHNVVAVKKDNSLDNNVIIDVYQVGYKIKNKIIRYAQVVVNKGTSD